MSDPTEAIRRSEVSRINAEVESNNIESERKRLETKYGKVWNTDELSAEFTVEGFMAPYVIVKRKADNKKGSMEFQHNPRFYFNFVPN